MPTTDMAAVMSAIRLHEMDKPDHLYEDSYAATFAGKEAFAALAEITNKIPYFEELLSVRHKLFIDFTIDLIANDPLIKQIISIGAGYCSMIADLMKNYLLKGYEIDQPDVCQRKEAVLVKPNLPILLPMDITKNSILEKLIETDFSERDRTIYLMEGGLYYFKDWNSICNFFLTLSQQIQKTQSYLIFDMQVGKNPLSPLQREKTKENGINDCFLPLSHWSSMLESIGLNITFYGNIAMLDRWHRLQQFRGQTKSAVFIVTSS